MPSNVAIHRGGKKNKDANLNPTISSNNKPDGGEDNGMCFPPLFTVIAETDMAALPNNNNVSRRMLETLIL